MHFAVLRSVHSFQKTRWRAGLPPLIFICLEATKQSVSTSGGFCLDRYTALSVGATTPLLLFPLRLHRDRPRRRVLPIPHWRSK